MIALTAAGVAGDCALETMRRHRRWIQPAAALLLAAAAWLVFTYRVARGMPDFEVYRNAGSRAAAAEPLYREADGDYQFKYFPAFAIVAIPLAAVPLPVAKAIWFGAGVASLVVLLRIGPRALPEMRRSTRWLVFVALVALGKYYARDLLLGQVNVIFTLVATGAIVAICAGREALGGALVALAVVFKPYALILLPWIAARRRRSAIVAATAGVAVVLVAPAVLYGVNGAIDLYRGWWTTVTTTVTGTLTQTENISIAAMYVKWMGPGAPAWPATATSAALLLAAGWVILSRGRVARPEGLEAALLLAITPLVSPQGWDYVLVVSTVAIMYLANYFDRLPRILQPVTVMALAISGLTLHELLGRAWVVRLSNWGLITVSFLIVVAALCTLRAKRVA